MDFITALLRLSSRFNQLHHHLAARIFWMLQGEFDRPWTSGPSPTSSVIETSYILAGNDLFESAARGIPDLDKITVEEHQEAVNQTCCLGSPDKLHHYAATNVAVLVDINSTLVINAQKLVLVETEDG